MQHLKKNILIFGHEASLTGAPILLLNLIGCLKDQHNFKIVLKRGGDLEAQFSSIANTIILKHKNYSVEKNFVKKVIDRLVYFFKQMSLVFLYLKADVIFSNTVCNGRLLNRFKIFQKPVFTYVHELESMLQYFDQWKDTSYSLKLASKIFYPSNAVQNNLIKNHQVSINKTAYLPYYFPHQNFEFDFNDKLKHRKVFLQQWSIPDDAFLVVGMGMVSERKGTNHFIEVAKQVIQKSTNIYFIWVGDFSDEDFAQQIKNDFFENRELPNIIFTGKLPYSTNNLLPFDLFFLSSVEDPYPLVVLEAAFQYVPTLCFEDSGGITEFIEKDFGFNIANKSESETAKTIIEISQNAQHLKDLSLKVRNRVLLLHSNKEQTIEHFNIAIKNL